MDGWERHTEHPVSKRRRRRGRACPTRTRHPDDSATAGEACLAPSCTPMARTRPTQTIRHRIPVRGSGQFYLLPTVARLWIDILSHNKYHFGMNTTIDRAGRLVIPKKLREQFNLTPGCELEISAGSDGLTLRRAGQESALIRKHGILVHHGLERTSIDIGEFVRREREVRHARLSSDIEKS